MKGSFIVLISSRALISFYWISRAENLFYCCLKRSCPAEPQYQRAQTTGGDEGVMNISLLISGPVWMPHLGSVEMKDSNNNKQDSDLNLLYVSIWGFQSGAHAGWRSSSRETTLSENMLSFIHYRCVTAGRLLGPEGRYDNNEVRYRCDIKWDKRFSMKCGKEVEVLQHFW